jgi:hypothetical protein
LPLPSDELTSHGNIVNRNLPVSTEISVDVDVIVAGTVKILAAPNEQKQMVNPPALLLT